MAHYNSKGRKNEARRADKPKAAKGHSTNKSESNRQGHEEGDTRRGVDKGGEKGDRRRTGNNNKRDGQSK